MQEVIQAINAAVWALLVITFYAQPKKDRKGLWLAYIMLAMNLYLFLP